MKTAPVAESAKPKSNTGSARTALYVPIDFVMVRAPLLPVQSYFDLTDEERLSALLSDPRVRRAVSVGSPSLMGALQRFQQSGLTQRDADRMHAKLLRYLIRMSTRPTPFGLFAGVALTFWAETTDVRIESTAAFQRTRPDMAWLMQLVFAAEAEPAVRKRLRFSANPLAVIEAGRVTVSERAPTAESARGGPVSVRASGVVKRALALARTPISHDDLVSRLCETTPSATVEKVEDLLAELWQQTLLLTDLRPPLTSENPAQYVAERLAEISEASPFLLRLTELIAVSSAFDSSSIADGGVEFAQVLAKGGEQKDDAPPLQVDMAMSVEGGVGQIVASEAARLAELLLRVTPAPFGLSSLASYRQAFLNRYGPAREVPLLEVLDLHRGLGPPSSHPHANTGPDQARAMRRSQTLLSSPFPRSTIGKRSLHSTRSFCRAWKLGRRAATAHPCHWTSTFWSAPDLPQRSTLANSKSSSAQTSERKPPAGTSDDSRIFWLRRDRRRWSRWQLPSRHTPLISCGQSSSTCPPIFVRPMSSFAPPSTSTRPMGTSAGVPAKRTIRLDELMVGVEHGCFYVRWVVPDRKVIFTSGHMLNPGNAPSAARFLADVSSDRKALFSSFDWGPAEGFPFCLESKRVELCCAPPSGGCRKTL